MSTYLVFDIETVPDYSVWSPPLPEPAKLREEKKPGKADLEFLATVMKRKLDELHPSDLKKAQDVALRAEQTESVQKIDAVLSVVAPESSLFPPTPFAPLYAHSPIVISYVWLESNFSVRGLAAVTAQGVGGEKALLEGWSVFLGSQRPTIVTWGGRGFDVPVINLRSFRWGVSQSWQTKDHRYRYNEDAHLDLLDSMTDFGAFQKTGMKLDTVSKLLGLPGKPNGVDGAQVERIYKEGGLDKIATYCLRDAALTALVLARFFLLRGRFDIDAYRAAAQNLLATFRATPALADLVEGVDEKTLLLAE